MTLHTEVMHGLEDAIERGDLHASHVDKSCILPSSFMGGLRYMAQNYQDAMAIFCCISHPGLFIMMACNLY